MKPAQFEYIRPTSVEQCLELLAGQTNDTKILAGGQSLVPLMNLRLARPELVLDVNGLADLCYERKDNDVLELGALNRHVDLASSPEVRRSCPLVADAASRIGYPAIRNRGTLGGSLAHADPAAELPCACVTSGAEIVVRGPEVERRVPAGDFFLGHFTTALEPSEMVVAVRLPVQRPGQGSAFEELARKTGDFAVVAVAAVISLAGAAISVAAISVAGVAGWPLRATGAEAALGSQVPSDELFASAGMAVTTEVAAAAHKDEGDFRAHVAGVLATRALTKAARRAAGEEVRDAN